MYTAMEKKELLTFLFKPLALVGVVLLILVQTNCSIDTHFNGSTGTGTSHIFKAN